MNDGYAKILDGTRSLSEAMRTFDKEGIQEITKLGGSSFQNLISRVKALREISGTFHNWYGITEGTEGSVVILFETESIKEN